ncbi:MAG: DUF2007 domain-containing protein [Bacteroidaceae bacterium]|nr:DUF2007 domain-containing protein [Bacteroidaceae bacterium]
MKTTRLTRCDNYWQAHLLKGALESAGIACALHNEFNLYSIGIANGISGVDVLVYEDDLERARVLLEEFTKHQAEMPDDDEELPWNESGNPEE